MPNSYDKLYLNSIRLDEVLINKESGPYILK